MYTSKKTPSKPLLEQLHWLPVHQRIKFSTALMVFKGLNGLAPGYISELLVPYIPQRHLRYDDKKLLTVPRYKNESCGKRSFSVGGPLLWNSLPQDIRCKDDIKQFRRHLKTYLFKQYYI